MVHALTRLLVHAKRYAEAEEWADRFLEEQPRDPNAHLLKGDYPGFWPPGYPFIPGHEWSGEVVATGSEAGEFQPDDRVVGECSIGCRTCAAPDGETCLVLT